MTQQIINIGSYNDDGTGDSLRVGAQKINENFTELYNKTDTIINGIIAGDGISVSYAASTGRVTINNTRVYQPSFSTILVAGNNAIEANTASSAFSFTAGENIAITTNSTSDSVTITAIWPESFIGDTQGTHTGAVTGNVTGNITGDIYGEVYSLDGTFKVVENANTVNNVRFRGKLLGNVEGNVVGNVVGDLVGDVTGDLFGNADTVTNGVYTTDLGTVTNAMLAGQITNSKLSNSSITINSQSVSLGGSLTILEYVLPNATNSTLGGVKVGDTLLITGNGVLETPQDLRTTGTPTFSSITSTGPVITNSAPTVTSHLTNKLYVDNAIAAIPPYVLPIATQLQLGGIRVGEGLAISLNDGILRTVQNVATDASPTFANLAIDGNITLSSPPIESSHVTSKQYVDTLYNTIPHYILPTASDELKGGIRLGTSLTIDEEDVCTTVQDIRTTAKPTFSGITVTTAPTADTDVTNKLYVDTNIFPIGGIIMWSGALNTIPDNWALCDGTNGTPNLQEKFIIGASTNYPMNSKSSTSSATTSSSGAHTHDVQIGGTALTTNQMPQHRHNFNDVWLIADDASGTVNLDGSTGRPARDANGNPADYFAMVGSTYGQYPLIKAYSDTNLDGGTNDNAIYTIANKTDNVGSGQTHTHTGVTVSAGTHTHTVSTIPPYYALAFIMKVG